MFENKDQPKTPLSEIGEFGLINHLNKKIKTIKKSTKLGIGDDAAIIQTKKYTVLSTDILIENIHFNIAFTPLKHLGYKAVIVNLSDIYAMNSKPTHIVVSLAVSNRYHLEDIEELYSGILLACKLYEVDLVGGDTTSSTTGLIINVTVLGQADINNVTKRSGAKPTDLLIVSGDLGAAFLGLKILERENEVFQVNPNSPPDLSPYSYLIERQLKPEARKDIPVLLENLKVVPTSMIDISDGLASELLHICESSNVGCKIFEDKIPIDPQAIIASDEFNLSSIILALNGGEDYELLFSISLKDYDKIKGNPKLIVIGHITDKNEGRKLISNNGEQISLTAQGWDSFLNKERKTGE